MSWVQDRIGQMLARYLERPATGYEPFTPSDPVALARTLRPGDVLLVEGNNHIAGVIKYLTQSTWSHAALYVGPVLGKVETRAPQRAAGTDGAEAGAESAAAGGEGADAGADAGGPPEPHVVIEANIGQGVVTAPLSKYFKFHTRVCRPIGLTPEDLDKVCRYAIERIGLDYDLKNIFDLLRYLMPLPVPQRWRRHMIALGSGDPTRIICSALIAQAFESVRYPILPRVTRITSRQARRDILEIRHSSLYAPRDFDISPYFEVVKPTIQHGFDYKTMHWADLPLPPDEGERVRSTSLAGGKSRGAKRPGKRRNAAGPQALAATVDSPCRRSPPASTQARQRKVKTIDGPHEPGPGDGHGPQRHGDAHAPPPLARPLAAGPGAPRASAA
jgi:Permuted papain-like amidase enzyme, YaeF/YiiX, C92 family